MNRVKSILIVEDDAALRREVARSLAAAGYLVFEADTFREATEQMTLKPALLILDLTLPDATGWDVAAWLESLTTPVPIVVISGGTPDAAHLQRFHPVAFLPKPFGADDLLTVVEEHLTKPATAFGV
jgi:two-component system KDP operon response regulator KdpE